METTTIYEGGELKQVPHIFDMADLNEIQATNSIDSLIDSTPDYIDMVNKSKVMKLMFSDKVFVEHDGSFTDKTSSYPYTLDYSIESVVRASFIEKGREEYLILGLLLYFWIDFLLNKI